MNRPQPPLYAWQESALRTWSNCGRQGIIEAVTGTGKTRVGVAAIATALAEQRHSVVIVPTKELQRQWYGALHHGLRGRVRIGRIGDGNYDQVAKHDVVVAIVNSMRDDGVGVPAGSLVVADECHRYASDENRRALKATFELRLGLTATLERPDRKEVELLDYFGTVCYRVGYASALTDGVVSPFTVALIGVPMADAEAARYEQLSKQIGLLIGRLVEKHGLPKTPFHQFMAVVNALANENVWSPAKNDATSFLSAVTERRDLMARSESKLQLAADLAPAMAASDRTIVFTESIAMAENVADQLRTTGLGARTIHSELTGEQRRQIFSKFASGTLKAIAAPRVLDEGIDVPAADLAIVVSGSRTKRQMIQRMGRVLRRKEDERLARIAILYLEGTTEDPRLGAHEAFLSEVTSVAEDRADFRYDELEEALIYLCAFDPFRDAPPPRLAGEPRRDRVASADDDEEVAVTAFFAV